MAYDSTIYAKDEATGEVVSCFVGETEHHEGRWIIARNNAIQCQSQPTAEERDRDLRLDYARRGLVLTVEKDGCDGYIQAMLNRVSPRKAVA